MTGRYRVGILGMGRVASGFDAPGGPMIRTHIKGILAEQRLRLTHVADIDPARAKAELGRFAAAADVVTPEAICAADLDVLCIASPDGTHLGYVERSATGRARVVLSEKPLDGDRQRRRRAASMLSARGASLAVNHTRRWIPGLNEWIRQARAGAYGKPVSAVINYNRGFRHNGAHALDLIAGFWGTAVTKVESFGARIADLSETDPTCSFLVQMNAAGVPVPLVVLGVDGRVQSTFSVDFRFEQARIVVFDREGINAEIHEPRDSGFPGFARELAPVTVFHDQPPRLFQALWRNIADHLENGGPLACAGDDALAAYELADSIAGTPLC